jgi:DNA polymerase-3 subunit gamma/tau
VVGQTNVTRTLRNALERGKIGHAFLLSGARGVGKTTTARILAKALNCSRAEGPTASRCSTRTDEDRAKACDSCREIADGHSLDVQEIDGASNTGIDNIRELTDRCFLSRRLGQGAHRGRGEPLCGMAWRGARPLVARAAGWGGLMPG